MSFRLTERVTIQRMRNSDNRCYDYAVTELARLLGRLDVHSTVRNTIAAAGGFSLCLSADDPVNPPPRAAMASIKFDGFVLTIRSDTVMIHARSAKGILNGVYELAESMGFLFLLPSDTWEWTPAGGREGVALACGTIRRNPRFPYRGTYGLGQHDFSSEQWLKFQAKLKFNAVGCAPEDQYELMEQLGMRVETGGHGLSALLPRKLFKTRPELFRMFQPEDFNGQRRDDSNLCAVNPAGKQVIQANYLKILKQAPHVHAAHAWADDLPGGGWCMCSLCRGLSPSDQYMLAMRHLAETIRKTGSSVQVPVIAYHDTIPPANAIDAPPESFLLYAPRERCYSHALDDASCYRNRLYLQALRGWMKRFPRHHDAHTFEYYFDQLLFRGMYPFMPGVILDDMRVYQREGIRSHMTIQVCGFGSAPDLNMHVFAEGHWDAALTPQRFIDSMARRIDPAHPAPWRTYLTRRHKLFQSAMRFCDYPFELYLDYRFLPENVLPFGRKMAKALAQARQALTSAAQTLGAALPATTRRAAQRLAQHEVRRARFEAAELHVMALQQEGVNHLGDYLSRGTQPSLKAGLQSLNRAIRALADARQKAMATGMPESVYYLANLNGYLKGEFERKIKAYTGHSSVNRG